MLPNDADSTGRFLVRKELITSKGTLEYGDTVKVKGQRGKFIFEKYVINPEIDKSWVDVISVKNNSFHSFRPEEIQV